MMEKKQIRTDEEISKDFLLEVMGAAGHYEEIRKKYSRKFNEQLFLTEVKKIIHIMLAHQVKTKALLLQLDGEKFWFQEKVRKYRIQVPKNAKVKQDG